MRPNADEDFHSWSERVAMYEKGYALQRIAQGENVETVMEDMSRRITQKLLHPIFKLIKENASTPFDAEKSKANYEAAMKYHEPVADHVDGNLFDKPR